MSRRVAVTGVGVVSPWGVGREALWDALARGATAGSPTPPSARGIPTPRHAGTLGASVRAELEGLVDARFLRRLSAISATAVAASVDAFADALGSPSRGDPGGAPGEAARSSVGAIRWSAEGPGSLREETSVVLGTAYGSSRYHFEYYEGILGGSIKDASPLLFSESVMNAPPGHVSIYHKLRGASQAIVGGEEAGLGALHEAWARLAGGETEAALAGGAEELCDFVHAALAAAGIVGEGATRIPGGGASRPFVSEGAVLLLLEACPLAAGTVARAMLRGAGAARAAGRAGALRGRDAVARAVAGALASAGAGLRPDLIVSSASGGVVDREELLGILDGVAAQERRGATGGDGDIPVVLPKAALGEGFAFTSAALAALAVECLRRGAAPPSVPGGVDIELPPGLRTVSGPDRRAGERPPASVLVTALNQSGHAEALVFGARGVNP